MNANDVLIDLLEDNRRRLQRGLDKMSDDCVQWNPEPNANNIAITIWHMARILDVFLTRNAKGELPAEECWFRLGWADRTGYDPRGIGQNGWGMLTGYTQEEVAAMPPMTREQVLGYLDNVYDAVKDYLAGMSGEKLLAPCAGFEGKYSKYQCIQMALMDNIRHLGEIFAIESSWKRRKKQPDPESKGRRSIRLEGYDYSQAGGYFITISTSGRKRLFGNVAGGEMQITELGKILQKCWDDIPFHFSNVTTDAFVVMPNHVHGILFIHHKEIAPVGAQHAAPLPLQGISTNVKPGSLGAIVRSFKSAVSRRAEMELYFRNVWQRNYYEHIIRDNADYERIASYILNNPVNWDCDEENI